MNLTVRTDLALRMLLVLAAQPEQEIATSQIADAFGVSLFHLQKIGKQLTKRGWAQGSRGRNGGIRLAVAADQLRLDTVVRTLESDFALVTCLERPPAKGDPCRLVASCALKGAFSEALDAFFGVLAKYSVADLANGTAPAELLAIGRPRAGRTRGPKAHPAA